MLPMQLREPLLLIGVYFIFFALVIIYCRCNFVLTRGTAWEAEDKAERTAFLVGEITSLIAGKLLVRFLPLVTLERGPQLGDDLGIWEA